MRFNKSRKGNIVNDGLVLYLDAGIKGSYPGSGTTWTDLAQSNDGTLTNSPTFDSANGGSFFFNATVGSFVSITTNVSTNQATFLSWIKRIGGQVAYSPILLSRGQAVSGMNFASNGSFIGYHWNNAQNTYDWGSNLTAPDSSWCMCAVSVTNTAAIAYLCTSSGISLSTNSVTHGNTILDNFRIGRDSVATDRKINAYVGASCVYNRALTAAEIAQNFEATRNRFGI